MLRTMFFGLAVLGLAATSQAALIITEEASATVNKPGFTTFRLTATSDPGTKIIGFNFVGDGSLGFTGPMNQVTGGPITSAVFNDSNGFFPFIDADVSQDSQFSVAATGNFTVNPSESATSLKGAFNYSVANAAAATNVLQFAQLAIPDAAEATVQYVGDFTVRDAAGAESLVRVQGTVPGFVIPEPSTFALAGLALVGLIGYSRRK